MFIEDTKILPDVRQGRPSSYPFDQLKPGQRLVIPVADGIDIKQRKTSVFNSLNYYKEKSGLTFKSLIVIEERNIVVYRID